MGAIDAALLALGIGQLAMALIADATAQIHGPILNEAGIGSISTDYPDLLLAAKLGGIVAGNAIQRRAAVLVTTLAAGYGMLLPVVDPRPPQSRSHLRSFCALGASPAAVADGAGRLICRYAASERLSSSLPRPIAGQQSLPNVS